MNAAIEKAFANLVRAATLPAGAPNAGSPVIPAGVQVEPNTSGNMLDPEKDWLVCKVETNDHIAGPLWRGTFAFHLMTRALTDPPDSDAHVAVMKNIRNWLRLTSAGDLAVEFAEHCQECVLAGTFVAGSPDPEQREERWTSVLNVTCGWREV